LFTTPLNGLGLEGTEERKKKEGGQGDASSIQEGKKEEDE